MRFASDLELEAFNDGTAMIGGLPWEMRHNYPSMMTLHTIIFIIINEAMIIERSKHPFKETNQDWRIFSN